MIELDTTALAEFLRLVRTPPLYQQPYVYRCYAADALLYVGMGTDLRVRLRNHSYVAPWWSQVQRVTVETGYPSFRDALKAELTLVREGW